MQKRPHIHSIRDVTCGGDDDKWREGERKELCIADRCNALTAVLGMKFSMVLPDGMGSPKEAIKSCCVLGAVAVTASSSYSLPRESTSIGSASVEPTGDWECLAGNLLLPKLATNCSTALDEELPVDVLTRF